MFVRPSAECMKVVLWIATSDVLDVCATIAGMYEGCSLDCIHLLDYVWFLSYDLCLSLGCIPSFRVKGTTLTISAWKMLKWGYVHFSSQCSHFPSFHSHKNTSQEIQFCSPAMAPSCKAFLLLKQPVRDIQMRIGCKFCVDLNLVSWTPAFLYCLLLTVSSLGHLSFCTSAKKGALKSTPSICHLCRLHSSHWWSLWLASTERVLPVDRLLCVAWAMSLLWPSQFASGKESL